MVAVLRALLPLGASFCGYMIEARIHDACRAPLQLYVARASDERAARIYCAEATERSPESEVRFLAELEKLRRIEHERIPRILNGGLEGGIFWVAVSEIHGVSLFDAVTSGAFFDPMHVVMMIRDAVVALRLARDAGVLHGRLTPRNVLTSAPECLGVLELGFDRLFGPSDEGHNIVFRAPEQLEPESEIDERADIYALGALGYFALGAPPFEDTAGRYDLARIRRRILAEDLPPLSRVRPDCPPAVENLMRLMCSKQKGSRPQTYEELDDMLERTLAICVARRKGQGEARPVSPVEPIRALQVAAPPPLDIVVKEEEPADRAPLKTDAPPAAMGALHAPSRPAGASSRAELLIVAVAVVALGGVAVLVSVGAVVLAVRADPPPTAPVVLPAISVAFPLTVAPEPARPPVMSSLLSPPSPPPGNKARPTPRASSFVPTARPPATVEPAAEQISASQARGSSMLYRLKDR